jgi:hypothetical protein
MILVWLLLWLFWGEYVPGWLLTLIVCAGIDVMVWRRYWQWAGL